MQREIHKKQKRANPVPTLLYTRGMEGNASYSTEEVYIYFKTYKEFKLASKLFWLREFSRMSPDRIARDHGIFRGDLDRLMTKYRKFMKHEYPIKNKTP